MWRAVPSLHRLQMINDGVTGLSVRDCDFAVLNLRTELFKGVCRIGVLSGFVDLLCRF